MLYTITGADRSTGNDVTQTFDAKSPAEAESIASLSMLVSKVAAEPGGLAEPRLAPVAYATPLGRQSKDVNWAAGLAFDARLLRIMSWIVAATALLPALGAIRELFNTLLFWGPAGFFAVVVQDMNYGRLIAAVLLAVTAVVMRIIAHATLALRDFATRPRP